jgi:hypothetical protein
MKNMQAFNITQCRSIGKREGADEDNKEHLCGTFSSDNSRGTHIMFMLGSGKRNMFVSMLILTLLISCTGSTVMARIVMDVTIQ